MSGEPVLAWEKLGIVYGPSGDRPWRRTHASLPLGMRVGEHRYRVYFASRDEENRSHVGWVELSTDGDPKVVAEAEEPALAPGPLGNFDDHGVYPASLVEHDGRLLLFYIGWNPGAAPPLFYASIGLAASDDGGLTFSRERAAPLLARSEFDPCLVTSPCVMIDEGRWRMWYVSGFEWTVRGGRPHSLYDIKYAESDDGLEWRREGLVCIGHKPGETNIARPWVLRERGFYRMWCARAGDAYRLGYAESEDGLEWNRLDERVGIEPSSDGWDSEAMAYPCVLSEPERLLLLYNGNDYGREGFGLAVSSR
jgi:BNR repeat-like domain